LCVVEVGFDETGYRFKIERKKGYLRREGTQQMT
jgi:hypothetical protein